MAGRPELARALADLDAGDELVIAEWDRATRSMWDGLQIIKAVIDARASIKVLDRSYIDLTTPMGRGFMAMMSANQSCQSRCRIARRVRSGFFCFYRTTTTSASRSVRRREGNEAFPREEARAGCSAKPGAANGVFAHVGFRSHNASHLADDAAFVAVPEKALHESTEKVQDSRSRAAMRRADSVNLRGEAKTPEMKKPANKGGLSAVQVRM